MLLTFTVSNGWLVEVMLPIVRTPLHTTLCPPLLVAASHVRSSGQVGEVGGQALFILSHLLISSSCAMRSTIMNVSNERNKRE